MTRCLRRCAFLGLLAALPSVGLAVEPQAAATKQLDREQLDRTLDEALSLVEEKFLVRLTREEIVTRALNLLLRDLDPYSHYLDPRERALVEADLAAAFGGIGVRMALDEEAKVPRVTHLLADSPAAEAGVRIGDLLARIDGHAVGGWSLERSIGILRGEAGSIVELSIVREGVADPLPLRLERRVIAAPSVHGAHREASGRTDFMLSADPPVGYVRIGRLARDTAVEVERALGEVHRRGAKVLVLDLRDCSGGLMQAAVDTADLFLDEGVILTITGRDNPATYRARPGTATALPMAVLINEGTASSGEILAGALRDHERGTFIGQRTFGKGRIQTLYRLRDDLGAVNLSTGTFQRPSGRTIDRHDVPAGSTDAGVAPHPGFEVAVPPEELAAWREAIGELDGGPLLSAPAHLRREADRVLDLAIATLLKPAARAAGR